MDKIETMFEIHKCGLVPAVRVETESQALMALDALLRGGIHVAEVTMSMNGAAQILQTAVSRFGQTMILGAGTVLDPETARHCILAGATFIVTPTVNPAVIKLCRRYGVPVLSGALTPTEVVTAWEAGADCVKVFPVSAVGGPAYIRALKGPLPQVNLMPMGGVSLDSVVEFVKAGVYALGVGSDLVRVSALRRNDHLAITEAASAYRKCLDAARNPALSK